MAKIYKLATDVTTESGIGKNSEVIANGDLLSKAAGVVIKTIAGGSIVGISHSWKTFTVNNQTVAKEKAIYVKGTDDLRLVIAADGAISQANEWQLFDINSLTQTVHVLTASATTGQVQMIEFVDQANSVYAIVNK